MNKLDLFVTNHVLDFKCNMCGSCCRVWNVFIDDEAIKRFHKIAKEDYLFKKKLKINIKENKIIFNFYYNLGLNFIELIKYIRIFFLVFKSDIGVRGSLSTIKKIYNLNNYLDYYLELLEVNEEHSQDIINILLKNAKCGFLEKDNRCFIHKNYGKKVLADICYNYPRRITVTNRGIEIGISYSCKEAAKLLDDDKKLEFIKNPEHVNVKVSEDLEREEYSDQYFEIEKIVLEILQNRKLDICERLILVARALTSKGINLCLCEKDIEASVMTDIIDEKNLLRTLNLVKEILSKIRKAPKAISKEMYVLLDSLYNKTKLLDDEIEHDKLDLFKKGFSNYYKQNEKNLFIIYENYYINFILSRAYSQKSLDERYYIILGHYLITKFLVINLCIAKRKKVTKAILINAIAGVERYIIHNKNYCEDIVNVYKKKFDILL